MDAVRLLSFDARLIYDKVRTLVLAKLKHPRESGLAPDLLLRFQSEIA